MSFMLHLRQLIERGVELGVFLLSSQTLIFFIGGIGSAGNGATERNRTAYLNKLEESHSNDNSSHANTITSKCLLDFGRHALSQSGVDVQELRGDICSFFLRRA